MKIFVDKTQVLFLFKAAKLQRKAIKLQGQNIREVKELNILGCILDPLLNWNAHVLHLRVVTKILHFQLLKMSGH